MDCCQSLGLLQTYLSNNQMVPALECKSLAINSWSANLLEVSIYGFNLPSESVSEDGYCMESVLPFDG